MKNSKIEVIDYIISWIENVGVTYDMEVSCYDEEFKKIKQDLEVLEIIKNKNVRLKSLEFYLRHYIDLESVLKAYNFRFIQLTLEELLKLKQWLEENE